MNKNLKLVYSQTDIIQANPDKGISDLIRAYDLTKEFTREYNSKYSDQVELSKLSEPFKEFYNYKEVFFKEKWDKIKDKLKRVTEGDYFFSYRASYEISFYDEKDRYLHDDEDYYKDIVPKGSKYWTAFRTDFFNYCETNNRWFDGVDIWNKPFDWLYREKIFNLLVNEHEWKLWEEFGFDKVNSDEILKYKKQLTESDIDEKILQLEKEQEEKKLAIQKSWEI